MSHMQHTSQQHQHCYAVQQHAGRLLGAESSLSMHSEGQLSMCMSLLYIAQLSKGLLAGDLERCADLAAKGSPARLGAMAYILSVNCVT